MSENEDERSQPLLASCKHDVKKLKVSTELVKSAVPSQVFCPTTPNKPQLESTQDTHEEEWIKEGYQSKFDWAVENQIVEIDQLQAENGRSHPHRTQDIHNAHSSSHNDEATVLLGCGTSPCTSV